MSEYHDLCHAMQTGVAYDLEHDPSSGSPKHLRVGVNSAMCDHTALVRLLLAKGIITEQEYEHEVTEEMRREVQRYQDRLRERYPNAKITLW